MEKKRPQPGNSDSLVGKVLIAMPQLQDPRFYRTVVYMCGHDSNGAMGLILNRHVQGLSLKELFEQLTLTFPETKKDHPIRYGGPVEMGRGFVLHTSDYRLDSSVLVNDHITLTATVDVLKDMAAGHGPKQILVALGYAGWSAGQLETEIQQNSWLELTPPLDLIFSEDIDNLWHQALKALGITPELLSSDIGHA